MNNEKSIAKLQKELKKAILKEKSKGTPDLEIGKKYGVTFRYIEQLITHSQGLNISALNVSKKIKRLHPKDFKGEKTTVWSFKQRGTWATHSGEYRGNWSPYIPRNVILKYSKPDELVLDYFCGAGTTAVECKLLERRCIALDINDKAIELARKNVGFNTTFPQSTSLKDKMGLNTYDPELLVGDARDLSFLQDNSIDLICAHPPYANIIHYTNSKKGDLSFYKVNDFLKEMTKVANESFRVLKPGRKCAILIGDMRQKKHVVALGFKLINIYLDAGFKLRELVIKQQHNCKTTGFWYDNSIKYNFLLLAHEYLPIFEKPEVSVSQHTKRSKTYGLIVPSLVKSQIARKLNKLETTSVWILPELDFEKALNKNVINRYSKGNDYLTISLTSNSKNERNLSEINKHKNNQLLFIKSPLLNNVSSQSWIENYLISIKDIIAQGLPKLNKGGFVAIQTKDVRVNGYIEPLAKRIVDALTHNSLWLKEIIILTPDRIKLINKHDQKDYLEIIHQYLLIYEVKD